MGGALDRLDELHARSPLADGVPFHEHRAADPGLVSSWLETLAPADLAQLTLALGGIPAWVTPAMQKSLLLHHLTHQPGGTDPMAVDAAVATGSLRTIGTGATQAAPGTVDAAAGTGSVRTLGSGALQATAGNDSRLSDARTPTGHHATHDSGGSDGMVIDAAAATGSLRTLGTTSVKACAGNDSRLSDSRNPLAHASSHKQAGSDATTMVERIASITIGIASTISFTSIPGGFRHLEIIWMARGDTNALGVVVQLNFNSDGGGNYDDELYYGTGNAAAHESESLAGTGGRCGSIPALTATANNAGSGRILIPMYAGTAFKKTWSAQFARSDNEATGNQYAAIANGKWRNTAAITQIDMAPTAGQFVTNSTFDLYGWY